MKTFGPLAVIAAVLFLAQSVWYSAQLKKREKMDWSPCGNTNLTTKHNVGRNLVFLFFDDGKRLWRITGIKSPASDGTQPVVEMVVEFERSPENCAIWKMEKGIKD